MSICNISFCGDIEIKVSGYPSYLELCISSTILSTSFRKSFFARRFTQKK